MDKTTQLEMAKKIAKEYHKDQVDRGGKPYFHHLEFVANHVTTDTEKTTAYLHDIVEDTDMTVSELETLGFDNEITEAVNLLTKKKGVPYEHYIESIKNNPIAKNVKLADLLHNSDLTRLKKVGPKDLERSEKYKDAIRFLSEG